MKKLFYFGLLFLSVFEILRVYFIMPMPGSQQLDTVELAYTLHVYRWYLRIAFLILIILGIRAAFSVSKKWIPVIPLIITSFIFYAFNFQMTAESMFRQPEVLAFATRSTTSLSDSTTVLAIHHNGETKAYPLRYIIYHHQVRDSVGGKPIMVTYCSVCRTGRVFDPQVNEHPEEFRLVGMDHFNAMFEDATTKSWWMQATGEAVVGPLKGTSLAELESFQATLQQYFQRYPFGKVMQPDNTFRTSYDTLGNYEWGYSKSALTGTDSLSWNEKSWVVGVHLDGIDKAYDWNLLKQKHILHDSINNSGVLIAMGSDNQSFSVFKRNPDEYFTIHNDTLTSGETHYSLLGKNLTDSSTHLKRIQAYQEFWHSWRTFHPNTLRYIEN